MSQETRTRREQQRIADEEITRAAMAKVANDPAGFKLAAEKKGYIDVHVGHLRPKGMTPAMLHRRAVKGKTDCEAIPVARRVHLRKDKDGYWAVCGSAKVKLSD